MFILLVEDDPLLRSIAKTILRKEGFHTIQAAHGIDGYNIVRQIGGSIDLLLTDLNMPGVGGLSLAQSVKELHPQMPILLMTGEPFLPRTLLEAVQKVMVPAAKPASDTSNPSRLEVVELWRTLVRCVRQVRKQFVTAFRRGLDGASV